MNGSPDIIILEKNLAIFVHGCFWHKCKNCYKKPVNNKEFWEEKMERNIERDKKNLKTLKKEGWKTLVIWECDLKNNKKQDVLFKIRKWT